MTNVCRTVAKGKNYLKIPASLSLVGWEWCTLSCVLNPTLPKMLDEDEVPIRKYVQQDLIWCTPSLIWEFKTCTWLMILVSQYESWVRAIELHFTWPCCHLCTYIFYIYVYTHINMCTAPHICSSCILIEIRQILFSVSDTFMNFKNITQC